MRWPARVALLVVGGLGCRHDTRTLPACDQSPALPWTAGKSSVHVVAAGDIGDCTTNAHRRTAALVDKLAPDAVFALGDIAYPDGSLDDFLDCYHSSWGRFRSITRATVGNHEYHVPHAGPYFAYFCGSSGEPARGWYSFDIGKWHVVALNSNCGSDSDVPAGVSDEFGGCAAGSPQARWLEDDLRAHPAKCTLAMWHHPRFTSGTHGDALQMRDLWRILDAHGADLVLAGHVHNYERFAPLDAEGKPHPSGRMRELSIGTGGHGLTAFGAPTRGSEVRDASSYGVVHLTLNDGGYTWEFVPAAGSSFTDHGEGTCAD